MRRPRWRKMTWVLIAWCTLILVWVIAGSASNDCAEETSSLAQDACATGTGIGALLVLFIGFVGFLFFSLIWFMSRPRTRSCPRCGSDVKKGLMQCPSCEFDFRSIATAENPPAPTVPEA